MPAESWTDGYVTGVDYTHGYYRELSPTLQRFALLCAGIAPPELRSYLELGCGQGLSACIHAAATECDIWATDFNPSQVVNAQDLLRAADIPCHILDQSFAEFLTRDDLPAFSHIGAHGIWTWVSAENRARIVEILRRNLAVGGAAYLSYNTLPGWGTALGLRRLMCLHAEMAGSASDGVLGQVEGAIAFAKQLMHAGSVYFKLHQDVCKRLEMIEGQNRQYVAHEYFNRDWEPMHFADCAEKLASAKLEFAASVNMLDHVDAINLTQESKSMVHACTNTVLRETMRDFCVNQYFRRDLFLRGYRRLSGFEQSELLGHIRIALVTPVDAISLELNAPVGKVGLQEAVYRPLIEALAGDAYRPKTLAELHGLLGKLPSQQIFEAVTVLIGIGYAHPCQESAVADRLAARAKSLNREICRRARFSEAMQFLASSELGGGVNVSRLEQLFLLARDEGAENPEAWARSAWTVLERQGVRLEKDGRPLDSSEENLAEFVEKAKIFASTRLPILKAVQIA